MNTRKVTEQDILLSLAMVGVFSLLAYTFKHTGGLLSRYVEPAWIGYVAAFGIESTIVGMSYRLSTLKKKNDKSTFLKFVLITALIVSSMANIAEGYQAHYGEALTLANILQIDVIQAVVWLSATFLMSLLVFAISEILGGEVTTVADNKRKLARQMGKSPPSVQPNEPALDRANDARRTKQDERRQTVSRLLSEGLSAEDIAGQLGVHKRTISRDIKELEDIAPGTVVITRSNGKVS